MDTLRILDTNDRMEWDYDSAADVLYMTLGEPEPALGIDIGEGLVLRYSKAKAAVVGLTVVGLKSRLEQSIGSSSSSRSDSKALIQTTKDIEALFAELDQTYDKTTPIGALTIATKTVEAIESQPTQKERLLNALKEGGTTALEEAITHPAIKPVVAAFKGYLEA